MRMLKRTSVKGIQVRFSLINFTYSFEIYKNMKKKFLRGSLKGAFDPSSYYRSREIRLN